MSEASVFPIEMPEGTFYVHIRAGREGERGQPFVGLLQVTTDSARDVKGYVTLRGRKYRIDYYMKTVAAFMSHRTGREVRWAIDHTPYNGGNRNENGHQVDITSSVDNKLDDLRDRALDVFAEANPGWVRLSERLRLEAELSRAEGETADLFRQAQVSEAKAAALRSRLESYRVDA